MKHLILYHAGCWDGFCAAWVARLFLVEELTVRSPRGVIRRLFWGPSGFQEFPSGEFPSQEVAS